MFARLQEKILSNVKNGHPLPPQHGQTTLFPHPAPHAGHLPVPLHAGQPFPPQCGQTPVPPHVGQPPHAGHPLPPQCGQAPDNAGQPPHPLHAFIS